MIERRTETGDGWRVAYFVSHPIQYQAPLLRYLAREAGIKLRVFFYSDFSVTEHLDPGYGVQVKWDVPLLQGYEHSFLRRVFKGPAHTRKRWNPALGVKGALRGGQFDAVWVHGWSHICSAQAIAAARRLRIPVLIRGESLPQRMTEPKGRKRPGRWWQSMVLKRAAGLLCIGSANREFYTERKVPTDRLFQMPYAVNNHFFQEKTAGANARRDAFRRELGLEPGRPVMLFTGRLASVKGPDVLLESIQLLTSNDAGEPKPYVLFVGDGPLRAELESKARALAAGTVRFLGFKKQTEIPAFYDLCDLLVLPSRFEPWGLVVNEVMNAARPVIVSDRVGAGVDLVTPGENGWIYPHADPVALAHCLREAVSDTERLRQMGERSLERISKWDFEADKAGLVAALSKVCSRG